MTQKISIMECAYLCAFVVVAVVLEHARFEEEVVDHAGKVESTFPLRQKIGAREKVPRPR